MSISNIMVKPVTTATTRRAASRKKSSLSMEQPLALDLIAREAYLIWELSGRPADRVLELWLQAEQRMSSKG